MSEENNQPKQYSPASPEELKEMERQIPADDKSIFDAFGENQSSIPGVIGGLIGLQDKDKYAILQRSNIDNEEIPVIINRMGKAEHGIGGGELDDPMPYVAERVKRYLEAKISITDDKTGHGMNLIEEVDVR